MANMEDLVLKVIEEYGIAGARPTGPDDLMAKCPFHESKDKNFAISIRTGRWICYAASCGEAGDLIKLVAKIKGVDRKEAEKLVYGGDEGARFERMLDAISFEEPPKRQDPPVKIPKLGLVDWSMMPDSMGVLHKMNIPMSQAVAMGLQYCTGPDYKGRIAIPMHDIDGKIVSYELRAKKGDGGKKVLYVEGSRSSHLVYGAFRGQGPAAVLVEGCKDVLTLRDWGYYTVSCYGTKVSDRQMAVMQRCGIREIILCLDNDEGGATAATKMVTGVDEKGKKSICLTDYFDVCEMPLPDGKDPNDCDEDEFRNSAITNMPEADLKMLERALRRPESLLGLIDMTGVRK